MLLPLRCGPHARAAQIELKPHYTLLFELFLLKGAASKVDKVVAWGAFPVCDSVRVPAVVSCTPHPSSWCGVLFLASKACDVCMQTSPVHIQDIEVLTGRYKIALLKGEVDMTIDRHENIAEVGVLSCGGFSLHALSSHQCGTAARPVALVALPHPLTTPAKSVFRAGDPRIHAGTRFP